VLVDLAFLGWINPPSELTSRFIAQFACRLERDCGICAKRQLFFDATGSAEFNLSQTPARGRDLQIQALFVGNLVAFFACLERANC
jgi:hypothetical protein